MYKDKHIYISYINEYTCIYVIITYMLMHVCVCVCVCMFGYICMYTCMCICIYIYDTHVRTYWINMCLHIWIEICNVCMCTYVYMDKYTCVLAYMYKNTCVCIYTYVYMGGCQGDTLTPTLRQQLALRSPPITRLLPPSSFLSRIVCSEKISHRRFRGKGDS